MDYEKKYNHALEVVRELQKDWASTQNRAAREIELAFPELRESEDERIRKAIVHLLEVASEAYLIEATGFKKEQFLSYLEKQKEPNPAEWSEEDERVYDILLNEFKQLYDGRATSLSRKEVIDVYNFVKSLRPSWKPSEEQMALLRAVISDPNNAGAESCQLVLREIYQQFKKL